MKRINFIVQLLIGVFALPFMATAYSGKPVWTFTPDANFPPKTSVSPMGTAIVKYVVQNQSSRAKRLVMLPQQGVHQIGDCVLSGKKHAGSSCVLNLTINAKDLPQEGMKGGPRLCQANHKGTPNPNQCYQPEAKNTLDISITNQPVCGNIYITNSGEGKVYIVDGVNHTFNANDCTKVLPATNSQPFALTSPGPAGAGNFYISDLQNNNVVFEYNHSLDQQLRQSSTLPISNDSLIFSLFAHQNNNDLYANTIVGQTNGVYPILLSDLSVGNSLVNPSHSTFGTALKPDGNQLWVGDATDNVVKIFNTTNNAQTNTISPSSSSGQSSLTSISFGQSMAYILFDNGGANLATLNVINDLNNVPSTISPVSTNPVFYDNTRFVVSAADDSTFAVVTMNSASAVLDIYSNTGTRNRICEFTMDSSENFSSFGFNSAQNEYVYVTFTVTTAPNVGTYKVYFIPNNSCSSTSLPIPENTTNNAPFFLSGIYIE